MNAMLRGGCPGVARVAVRTIVVESRAKSSRGGCHIDSTAAHNYCLAMRPEDLDGLSNVSDPQLSPDGRWVAHVVTRVDLGANAYRSHIWVVPSDGAAPARRLTDGWSDSQPRWTPDGSALVYTSSAKPKTEGPTQSLRLLPFSTAGEALVLAEANEAFTGVTISPDGRMVAFAQRVRSDDYLEEDPARRRPRKIEHLMFTLNGEGFICDRPSNIHVLSLDGSDAGPRNLTPGAHECFGPSWFPEGDRLAYSWNPFRPREGSDICVVDLSGNSSQLTDASGVTATPIVSPDGSQIAVLGFDDWSTMFQNQMVGLLDSGTTDATPSWISTSIDRTWASMMVRSAPVWTDGGLIAACEDHGNVHLHRVPTGGGEIEPILTGDRGVSGWSVGTINGGDAIAFTATTATNPAELFLLIDGEERQLTTASAAWVDRTQPIEPDRFVVAAGGVELDAWLFRPRNFEADTRYPMLMNVHGGPFAQYGNFHFDEFQMQADAGFVVLCTNPRGSSGRDTYWGASIRGPKHHTPGEGWGTLDYDDVMAVVDGAIEKFDFIDTDRMGILGGSYGGYMTTWVITHTDRFAAACSERAANNLLTLEQNSDVAGFFSAEMGPSHLDDPDEYLRMSPSTMAKNINTPLLIVHSEQDLRCPEGQATELFVACTLLEKDVEYWLFPAENHELSRSGSPVHRQQRAEIILEYFSRHLQ